MAVYQPNWIVDKHNEQKWADWKAAHPQWELRAAEIGVSDLVLKAWVIGATSYIPGKGVFADYDHGPLEREIGAFAKSEATEMLFGTGKLFLSADRTRLVLYGDDGVQSWGTIPNILASGLVDYQAAELLKEAWYHKADEVLASCSKANIPLAELYSDAIQGLEQAVSRAITAEMAKCGLLPTALNITPQYGDVQGVTAYLSCKVKAEVDDDAQVPVGWQDVHGSMWRLKTWK